MNNTSKDLTNHETLREIVYNYLRKQVICMNLKPGDRINEKILSDTLSISRGPIREALRQLEQEGLVVYKRNHGCCVQEFSISSAQEIFLIRASLESAACRYIDGSFSVDTLSRLEAVLNKMKQLGDNCNSSASTEDEFVQLDQEFHSEIARSCGLARLYKTWDSSSPLNLVLFLTDRRVNFKLEDQYNRHKIVFDAIKSGDTNTILNVIYSHYLGSSAIST